MDAEGNLYATDSWYPRILRLPAGGDALEQWAVDPIATRSLSAFWNVAGTADTPALLQAEGTCYATPSYWHGRPVIRFSFCNASTTQLDARRMADALVRVVESESESESETGSAT